MFNLKSIYFYFLAIQISLIKFIKKIYFSTNYYNKSLISKAPQQFYFHPNPFLLSSITNYKKYSFKISETLSVNPVDFEIKSINKTQSRISSNIIRITSQRIRKNEYDIGVLASDLKKNDLSVKHIQLNKKGHNHYAN